MQGVVHVLSVCKLRVDLVERVANISLPNDVRVVEANPKRHLA